MDYKQSFMEEQLNRMMESHGIPNFLTRYAQSYLADPEAQRTVILFPGGMASELARADQRFDATLSTGSYHYDTVWYDVMGILFLQHTLLMDMSGDFDRDQQMVVADGAIQNCLYGPYDDFRTWCGHKGLDLLVVGWDFRRRPDWIVEFFFDYLVPKVTDLAADANLPDPFARTAIVGHSFGGMVVKWILNNHSHVFCQNLLLAVIVGSPFYGSAGQPHRYFVGEPLAGLTAHRADIAKVISTFKGGYTLMFLDEGTYGRFAQPLSEDVHYPLLGYPSVADTDSTQNVDPYNPLPGSPGWFRYPDIWSWFPGYLKEGRDFYQAVAEPLHVSVEKKLHCIRGVKFQGESPAMGTAVSQRWGWVHANPNGECAVWEKQPDAAGPHDFGPGDGTIPAWSARLVTQPPQNIHTIEGDISHMTLLDDTVVRSTLLGLVQGIAPPDPAQQIVAGELRIDPASREELYTVRNDLERIATEGSKAQARRRVQAYIAEIPFVARQALMKRLYMEVMTGPIMPLEYPPSREQPTTRPAAR